jgi:hypothetical protein
MTKQTEGRSLTLPIAGLIRTKDDRFARMSSYRNTAGIGDNDKVQVRGGQATTFFL